MFFVRLTTGYALLMMMWLPLGRIYRDLLVTGGEAAFSRMPGVTFRELAVGEAKERGLHEDVDLVVLVAFRGDPTEDTGMHRRHLLAKSLIVAMHPYAPTAFLLALTIATRANWLDRLKRGALSVTLFYGWFFLSVWIDVLFVRVTLMPGKKAISSWAVEAVSLLHASVTNWPAGVFVVPLLLWAAIFRPKLSSAFDIHPRYPQSP